jgi:predicted dehydrogenase
MVSSLLIRAMIIGSQGRIEVPSPVFGPTGVRLTYGSYGSETTLVWDDHTFNTLHAGLSYQATALASYVAKGRSESPLHTLEETVTILATIDDAHRQIGAL